MTPADIDFWVFYVLWALTLISAAIQINYLALFLASRFKKIKMKYKLPQRNSLPTVTVLVASYNEKNVIAKALQGILKLDYPMNKIQVVVADDSDDGTYEIVRDELNKLKIKGIKTVLVHRDNREGLKSAALNNALKFVNGKYTLLIDADVILPTDIFTRAIPFLLNNPNQKFLDFEPEFPNRNFNVFTKFYSLSAYFLQETYSKSYSHLQLPFAYTGDSVLLDTAFVKKIGGWKYNVIGDDTYLSLKIWAKGGQGTHFSPVHPLVEAYPSYGILKKRFLRVNKGIAQAFAVTLKDILKSKLSIFQKIEVLLSLMPTLVSIFTLLFTAIIVVGIIFSLQAVQKIFTSVEYILLTSGLNISFLLLTLFIIKIKKLPLKDYILPVIVSGYILVPIAIYSIVGFFQGLLNKKIEFYRAPKFGTMENFKENYKPSLTSRFGTVEFTLMFISLALLALSIQKNLYYVTGISLLYLLLTLISSIYI